MKSTPRWIIDLIRRDRLDCSSCKEKFSQDDMIAIGIQESTQKPHNDTLTIGMFCKKCNELTIFELKEMTLVDLAFMILDEESDRQPKTHPEHQKEECQEDPMPERKERKRFPVRSKITMREIKETSERLQKIKTHDDFLAALGMSPEEIERSKQIENKNGK